MWPAVDPGLGGLRNLRKEAEFTKQEGRDHLSGHADQRWWWLIRRSVSEISLAFLEQVTKSFRKDLEIPWFISLLPFFFPMKSSPVFSKESFTKDSMNDSGKPIE